MLIASTIRSLEDLHLLRESVALECKLAGGRNGEGALPQDFWPTYSAMANTEGGIVILGVREHSNGQFELAGIQNPAKVRRELFNNLNNRQKISINLLQDGHVKELVISGKALLIVEIPRARRQQQPVHLTTNPFNRNTFRRLDEGDRPLADEDVKRMLAEQIEDSRDTRTLAGYSVADLDTESFRAYRQVFSNRDPSHPWNTEGDEAFLHRIGGWGIDRETGKSGLTLAGLLMFGQMHVIQEVLPNYMLDYQERSGADNDRRWIDRLTLDGKWSGNLYDFYRKVYLKLTAELKVPFQLKSGERQDETPVHIALREALANVLVHADYSERASVLIVKRPDMFGFRNPGLMRIPLEIALRGGEPDCRNRNLHKMFRFVGVGEQAGTGIPRIFQGWKSQHWNPPKLYESSTPYNQTVLELRMIDLFPNAVIARLRARFGTTFDQLEDNERTALALAASESTVTHARLCTVSSAHPAELTRALQNLTRSELLHSSGSGRGAVYFLPGQGLPTPDEVFGPAPLLTGGSSSDLDVSSSDLDVSSSDLDVSSSDLASPDTSATGQYRDAKGYLHSAQLPLPIIDDLNALSPDLLQQLQQLAATPRQKKKMDAGKLTEVILIVCEGHFMTLSALAELLKRQPASLRNAYLSPMVREQSLSLAFPMTPTHEKQAYCSTSSLPEKTAQE